MVKCISGWAPIAVVVISPYGGNPYPITNWSTSPIRMSYGYNNEGQVTSLQVKMDSSPFVDAHYTYSYDAMGRAAGMAGSASVSGVSYNAAGQMKGLTHGGLVETRQYNARLQLTRITVAGQMDVEYRYSATANNGQITSMKNWLNGEEVNYSYDALGRVTSAVTTGPEWGLSFGYDGFGNKVSQTVVKGSAPAMTIAVDGNNRVIGQSYDAAGFPVAVAGSFTSLNWDSLGRLLSVAVTGGGTDTYAYDAQNRRVWRNNRLFVRGAGGEVLALYDFNAVTKLLYYVRRYDWFAGKLAGKREDRLGTVETGSRFYPYGEESPATGQDAEVCDVLAGFEYGVGLCDGAVLFQCGGAVFDAGSVPGERVGGAERELEPVCVCGGGSG
jgi:YD repeat-containing protein